MLELLSAMVKGRLNVLISGGTGAGKTTLLNVLSGYIPNTERIVTIEDAAELQLQQEHVVRLETRPPNIEGKGAVRQRQLVINSLRMRPDRIIVGEVRGEEAFDMLQAMNTGHEGSLTTVHANTQRDALAPHGKHVLHGESEYSRACRPAADRLRHSCSGPDCAHDRRHHEKWWRFPRSPASKAKSSPCRMFLSLNASASMKLARCADYLRQLAFVPNSPTGWLPRDAVCVPRCLTQGWRSSHSWKYMVSRSLAFVRSGCGARLRGRFPCWTSAIRAPACCATAWRRYRKSAEREPSEELALLRDEMFSEIPALDNLLRRSERVSNFQTMLSQAGIKLRAGNMLFFSWGQRVLLRCILWWRRASPVFGWAGMFSGRSPALFLCVVPASRRFQKFEEIFPEAIDTLARAVRAGHAFTTALEMISNEVGEPVASEFRKLFEEQKFGMPVRDALHESDRADAVSGRKILCYGGDVAARNGRQSGRNLR